MGIVPGPRKTCNSECRIQNADDDYASSADCVLDHATRREHGIAAETVASKDLRLVEAAKSRNAAAAIALLQKKIDPNTPEPDGTTALHWAVRYDEVTLVERLIKAGAKVNAANRYGVTPIALACESGSAAVVEHLLKAGVSPNATGPLGETALHTCAHTGNVEAAKALLARGAAVNAGDNWRGQTPLMWAAAQGHPAMVRVLVEAGRRRQRAIDSGDLGAAAHRGAAREMAAAGRLHGPAARGPSRVRGLREGARVLGRQHQRDRPREPHRAGAGADERPLRCGGRADRGRHRRQRRRQRGPHGALRRRGCAHDARVQSARAEGRRLRR